MKRLHTEEARVIIKKSGHFTGEERLIGPETITLEPQFLLFSQYHNLTFLLENCLTTNTDRAT